MTTPIVALTFLLVGLLLMTCSGPIARILARGHPGAWQRLFNYRLWVFLAGLAAVVMGSLGLGLEFLQPD